LSEKSNSDLSKMFVASLINSILSVAAFLCLKIVEVLGTKLNIIKEPKQNY